MKKCIYFLALLGLGMTSCNDDDAITKIETSGISEKRDDDLMRKKELLNSSLIKLYGNTYSSKKDINFLPKAYRSQQNPNDVILNGLSKKDIQAAIDMAFPQSKICQGCDVVQAPIIHGPFHVGATVQIDRNDVQILWPGDGSGYPPIGSYIADVMIYRGWKYVPPGAVGFMDTEHIPSTGWGYLTNNNFNASSRGALFSSNPAADGGTHMYGTTYSIIMFRNMLGQVINSHKPFNAYNHNITYKFYYITF